MELMDHQIDARDQLRNGSILWGGTGSGKSATAVAYYDKVERPKDVVVITTAKKRDSLDWQKEFMHIGISDSVFLEDESYFEISGALTVDSWNNIKDYEHLENCFFIFDEQRVIGYGAWVKSFLKIAKKNTWILLSATPGDTWLDYAPVFIANGFYKNITDFKMKHVIYEPFRKYPVIQGYINEAKLIHLRNTVLVEMPYQKHTIPIHNWMYERYDKELVKRVVQDRWHVYENRPIKDVAEMFRVCRRVVNSDPSRLELIKKLLTVHPRLIIWYNWDYELEILRTLKDVVPVYEWNGKVKHPNATFEDEERWVYLVQYVAGSEAWNCTKTDAMVLYSLTYSYKNFIQAQGRNDRLDTPFTYLYIYLLLTHSLTDLAVKRSLDNKKDFNEKKWVRNEGISMEDFGDVFDDKTG